ncbi:MAG: bifunctional adenosylcobinamide kinase/adenosylcobinamide-phosphate guanylyltransferase [Fretibacterium sp.]|nr:bifunctional adenosylcobinamide kinase/adenosylcobinamide-phosphate guanylyltransferase [Fretibacterium sp.]
MHLILGGRYMGKLAWAESLYGPFRTFCDLTRDAPEDIVGARAVLNLQAGVRTLLSRDEDVQKFFAMRLSSLRDSVLIGDDVGEGIVPMDTFERRWRDEVGLLYQMLAKEADMVDRVWAGLSTRLKG